LELSIKHNIEFQIYIVSSLPYRGYSISFENNARLDFLFLSKKYEENMEVFAI
jgi:hypothetical protein